MTEHQRITEIIEQFWHAYDMYDLHIAFSSVQDLEADQ
jgi:hypothetical protein